VELWRHPVAFGEEDKITLFIPAGPRKNKSRSFLLSLYPLIAKKNHLIPELQMNTIKIPVSISSAIFAIPLLLALCVGCSKPPASPMPEKGSNYQAAREYARSLISYHMKRSHIVGCAVAIVDSERVIYSEGFGYADKKAQRKVDDQTAFMIGSISKLFTATAIMRLAEQGKVNLDTPITAYIPEFSVKARFASRPITVRDLLTHESGLPSDQLNGFILGQTQFPGIDTAYRNVPLFFKNEYMARPPHTSFSYCNLGFSLLGVIIERAGGVDYASYIQDTIMGAIGMHGSAISSGDKRVKTAMSRGYMGGEPLDPPFIRDIPAGSIVSSVSDMSLFVKMLLARGATGGNRVLSTAAQEQMWVPQNQGIPLDLDFRVGLTYWLINPTMAPTRVASHGGDIPPFHAVLSVLPDAQLGVVIMVNSQEGASVPMLLVQSLIKTFYEAKTGKEVPKEPVRPVKKIDQKILDNLTGLYATPMGLSRATRAGNNLKVMFSGLPLTLTPNSDSTFSASFKFFGISIAEDLTKLITFDFHTIGAKVIIAARFAGILLGIGERFVPETISPEWMSRVGTYETTNEFKANFTSKMMEKIFSTKTVRLEFDPQDKVLCVLLNGFGSTMRMPIKPISSTEAVCYGVSRNGGETVRCYSENGNDYFCVSGFIAKKIGKKK
jgi:CubicO group peptidase (beta-lactamase class C family)